MAKEEDYSFTYATPEDPRLKRLVIRLVERLSGQRYLKSVYDDYRANPVEGERFWDAAINRLDLKVIANLDALQNWPATGPLVVVSNHPFGILDGVVICHIASKLRQDFLVLTNAVLLRAEEMKKYLLPIDFANTEEALKTNLQTRNIARKHLDTGGCLIVFPAGGVSTTPKVWKRRAIDTDWKTFTAKLITQTKATVAPVFFEGQNSRLFQIASHMSLTLRLSLLFKEVHNRVGSEIRVRLGDAVPFEKLPATTSRSEFMQMLRSMTYALGDKK